MSMYKTINQEWKTQKYREFSTSLTKDALNLKRTEFDMFIFLGTRSQEQYIHYYISSLRTEIVYKTQGIIKK
ncbi:hypothetical protein [Escherichia phage vB_EcoM_CRJP21]|nr:hypothetical protein [Escherichia phage vB_EcoM_CRJP21]